MQAITRDDYTKETIQALAIAWILASRTDNPKDYHDGTMEFTERSMNHASGTNPEQYENAIRDAEYRGRHDVAEILADSAK